MNIVSIFSFFKCRGGIRAIFAINYIFFVFVFSIDASASETRDEIESLSALAGMADFCYGVFEDSSEFELMNQIFDQNSNISRRIAGLIRNEGDHYAANKARYDGLSHYRKLFLGDVEACKRLISTLTLLNSHHN